MQVVLIFGPPIICLWATTAILRYYWLRNALGPHRFAGIASIGLTVTVLLYYFLTLAVVGVHLDSTLIGLGVWLGFLHLVIGYPAAFFIYNRFLKPRKSAPANES